MTSVQTHVHKITHIVQGLDVDLSAWSGAKAGDAWLAAFRKLTELLGEADDLRRTMLKEKPPKLAVTSPRSSGLLGLRSPSP